MKLFRRVLAIVLLSTLLVGAIGWYRVAAEPIDGKLDLNISGGNWIDTTTGPYMVQGAYNSGARWTFVTVVWYSIEENAPSAPCPTLDGTTTVIGTATYLYYSHGPTGQCHKYRVQDTNGPNDLENLDQLIPKWGNSGGLRGNGNYIAMGMYAPPRWAGGQPCEGVGAPGQDQCAMIFRDHLTTFSNGALDLAHFLVERYNPGAFSVWNEPDGYRYLSIQPDLSRVYCCSGGLQIWPSWQDYVTYLLQPIANDLHPFHPGILIMGPELSTKFDGGGDSDNTDPNWCGAPSCDTGGVSVGFWIANWTHYILTNFPNLVDRWTLHSYSDPDQGTKHNVDVTWNEMLADGQTKFIWVTEANKSTGGCNWTQIDRYNWLCKLGNTQTWDATFWFPASDSDPCTDYGTPTATTGGGLMGSPGSNYAQKWLLYAFHQYLAGQLSC